VTPSGELDLVVIGDCNPDVLVHGGDVTPAFGQQEKLVDGMSLVIGGSASITAVVAARLGLRVALVAAIGTDPAGEFMLASLAAERVDTSAMVIRPDLPTGMTVALSRGGDRAILTSPGAIGSLTASQVPAELLARTRHLHVSSYFLLERSLGPGLAALFAAAREDNVTTSLDTNWDPAQAWGGDQLRAVLANTDLLLPNETEALHISGAASLDSAILALTAAGPRVVVKLGARGALAADGRQAHWVRPPPARGHQGDKGDHGEKGDQGDKGDKSEKADKRDEKDEDGGIVDTTGAGDCFNAGLITGLRRGMELPEAAALGCAVAAASIRAVGGTGARTDLATAQERARAAEIEPVTATGASR
jgi:sugar/nucleoside kinase (ribokinase family)